MVLRTRLRAVGRRRLQTHTPDGRYGASWHRTTIETPYWQVRSSRQVNADRDAPGARSRPLPTPGGRARSSSPTARTSPTFHMVWDLRGEAVPIHLAVDPDRYGLRQLKVRWPVKAPVMLAIGAQAARRTRLEAPGPGPAPAWRTGATRRATRPSGSPRRRSRPRPRRSTETRGDSGGERSREAGLGRRQQRRHTEIRLSQLLRYEGRGSTRERVGGATPCTDPRHLCPSCRIFGSVHDEKRKADDKPQDAYRGHVRIDDLLGPRDVQGIGAADGHGVERRGR